MWQRDLQRTVNASQTTLCTLAEAKGFLGIADTSQDTLLTRYLSAVTAQIEGYANNYIVKSTVVETIVPDDQVDALLLSYPGATITAFANDVQTLTLSDYFVFGNKGLVKTKDGSALPGQYYYVTYNVGYDSPYPQALVEAALECVRDLYNTKSRPLGLLSENIVGVGSRSYVADDGLSAGQNGVRLPLVCVGLLGPYVRTGWI